ncbi:MAG: glutamate--cysteine ligase [Chromatocurvus sp.]
MTSHWQKQLQHLTADHPDLLNSLQRGVEKESLRISAEGMLAQTPHPRALGSALTHSAITTDYSEALMEFITPVSTSIDTTLTTLADIHTYVYRHLGNERLWAASMPCIVSGDAGIPVAQYGSSNVARMKTVYRLGLGNRYGRTMQAIAGIHYNFSMPESYWQAAWKADGSPGRQQDYITDRYLGLIRNFHRWSWLLIYLFGASPAVCASFMRGRGQQSPLQAFDGEGNTLYLPHATALRMGGLGYNSAAQGGLNVCYNTLDNYIHALKDAIMQPHADYAAYAAGENGDYQQLNSSLLQIENEFYSTIRPKRVTASGETPLAALHRGGIEYIEVRCLDVNPFLPEGIDAETIRFLDMFLLHCLTRDSEACNEREQARHDANLEAVVNRGREPGLTLETLDGPQPMASMANALLDALGATADALDASHGGSDYREALDAQRAKIADPDLTPSARLLAEMRERTIPFYRLGLNYSNRWAEYFRSRTLSPETLAALDAESARSLEAQEALERSEAPDFAGHLAAYYAQYAAL